MAEHITADSLRERMENRLAYLHYNDQYHGRHAGVYEFLSEMLADDILEDDGASPTGGKVGGLLYKYRFMSRCGGSGTQQSASGSPTGQGSIFGGGVDWQ